MSAIQKPIPTDSELEVLQILWQHGSQTVRFVNDELNKKREVGYTTTLKIMQIMLDKHLLSREIINRSHIFTATAEETSTQNNIMAQFINNTFRGSASSLVMRLLDSDSTSNEELEKIKAFINQHTNS
jgi:BlaI family transcriptional regulator, penicillinase repressor